MASANSSLFICRTPLGALHARFTAPGSVKRALCCAAGEVYCAIGNALMEHAQRDGVRMRAHVTLAIVNQAAFIHASASLTRHCALLSHCARQVYVRRKTPAASLFAASFFADGLPWFWLHYMGLRATLSVAANIAAVPWRSTPHRPLLTFVLTGRRCWARRSCRARRRPSCWTRATTCPTSWTRCSTARPPSARRSAPCCTMRTRCSGTACTCARPGPCRKPYAASNPKAQCCTLVHPQTRGRGAVE